MTPVAWKIRGASAWALPRCLVRLGGALLLGCIITLIAAGQSRAWAAEGLTVSVDTLASEQDLSGQLMLLNDPDGRLSYREAAAQPWTFRAASRRDLATTFNAGVFWLRVTLLNPSAQPLIRWLVAGTPKVQQVSLHVRQGRDWLVQQSGRRVAAADKPVVALAPVFPLLLPPGEPVEILLRFDTRGATDMTTSLWDPQAYHFEAGQQQIETAALLGGLLICGVLALVGYARLREPQYFWLGLLLLAVGGLEASRTNFLATYLWPAHLVLPPASLAVFATLVLFSLSKVVCHALELVTRLPRADRMMLVLRGITLISGVLSLFSYGHGVRILSIISVVQSLLILALSAYVWYLGKPNARLFLLAFLLAIVTDMARQLANLGLLPWIAAMDFSTLFFLLSSPLILLGLAEQTRQLGERLRVSDELRQTKSAFFARISHELRSPLNTILGYSRMLGRGSRTLSLADGTAGIERSTLRLLNLISELLDEARAASGQLPINPQPTALRDWLDETAEAARVTFENKGNRLHCTFGGTFPALVLLDGGRLRQVVDNLLGNANRHTTQGTIGFECFATVSGREVRLDIAIEDTGEGIDAKHLQAIFQPFVRGATATPGHGLGLAICRELVRQMGGDISVTSTPGHGSRFAFSVRCPLVDTVTPAAAPKPSETEAPAEPSAWRALVVDDEAIQRELMTELLEEAGFKVAVADGGAAGIAQIDASAWDIVITDQMMPQVDGWAVLHHARVTRPGTPVLLLSLALPVRPTHLPANIQFDATLLKPALSDDLLAMIWHLVLKDTAGRTMSSWTTLASLAEDGDISGIEDWLTAASTVVPEHNATLRWIEGVLHRLDLALLAKFAANKAQAVAASRIA